MAAGTKLILRFGTTSGEKNFTYNYGNDEATTSSIKAAMNAIIANGSIFKYVPLTIISATSQVTTERQFDLSE